MKLSFAALVISTLTLAAQDYPAGQMKHLSVPTATSFRPISVAALDIERSRVQYPAVIHLKGSVEIKTPVCIASGKDNAHLCDGYIVVHAEAADFHEDSGQIEARGSVTVTRVKE